MSDIALHTFTLGDVPPRVHGVKVFRRESVVEELLLEMDLSWTGNQKFQLQVCMRSIAAASAPPAVFAHTPQQLPGTSCCATFLQHA